MQKLLVTERILVSNNITFPAHTNSLSVGYCRTTVNSSLFPFSESHFHIVQSKSRISQTIYPGCFASLRLPNRLRSDPLPHGTSRNRKRIKTLPLSTTDP